MKLVNGFSELLKYRNELEEPWCIFVNSDFQGNAQEIKNGIYYLPESEDEMEDMDEQSNKYKMWLEYATFVDVLDNKIEHHPTASENDFLEAIVYYLEEDDFLD